MVDIEFIEFQVEFLLNYKGFPYSKDHTPAKERVLKVIECSSNQIFTKKIFELALNRLRTESDGDVYYFDLEDEIIKKLDVLDILNDSKISMQTNADSQVDLTFEMQTNTKVLLLKELGILDLLEKKYAFKNKTEFAKLLAIIVSGNTENKDAISDTIRRYLSTVNLTRQRNPAYTDDQKKRINEIFAQFGIKTIK